NRAADRPRQRRADHAGGVALGRDTGMGGRRVGRPATARRGAGKAGASLDRPGALGADGAPARRDRRRVGMTWPERIRAIRAARGLTQAQLAVLIGAARNSVVGWEGGKREPERMAQMALLAAEAGLGRDPECMA